MAYDGLIPPATALVIAYDVNGRTRNEALEAAHFMGSLVRVCDGVNDQEDILAAVEALPDHTDPFSIGNGKAGTVSLIGGTFNLDKDLEIPYSYFGLTGQGFGTRLKATSLDMTNSLYLTGKYVTMSEMWINGNGKAVQSRINSNNVHLDHVLFSGHRTYELYSTDMQLCSFRKCVFYSKPMSIRGNGLDFKSCYFNAGGENECIRLTITDAGAGCMGVNIIGGAMESYAGDACINMNYNGSYYGINIKGVYFESDYTVTTLISQWAGSGAWYNGSIVGCFQATDAGCTNSVKMYNCYGLELKANLFTHPVVFNTITNIDVNSVEQGVTYNTLSNLRWFRANNSIKEFPGTAAPTGGTWVVGDTCWNTTPVAGGAPGWVCVTAGTPGTWKAMASLAS